MSEPVSNPAPTPVPRKDSPARSIGRAIVVVLVCGVVLGLDKLIARWLPSDSSWHWVITGVLLGVALSATLRFFSRMTGTNPK